MNNRNKKNNLTNIENDYIEKLNHKNKRMTSTRIDIINCLNDGNHHHTISDIIDHLKNKYKNLNVATIYNNLKFLLSEGIVDVYPNYDSQNQRYELIKKNNYHFHIREFQNGKEIFEDIDENIYKEINNVVEKYGYDIHNLKIEILVKNKIK